MSEREPRCSCGTTLVTLSTKDGDPEGIRNDLACPVCGRKWGQTKGRRYELEPAPDGPPEPGSSIPAMEKARRFPTNTCGASRHAGEIAEDLIRHGEHGLLADDAKHCGESIGWTVAALWEARSELAALCSRVAERDREIETLKAWQKRELEKPHVVAMEASREHHILVAADLQRQVADLSRRLTEAEARAAARENDVLELRRLVGTLPLAEVPEGSPALQRWFDGMKSTMKRTDPEWLGSRLVTIEPKGCPTPGACSCLGSATPASPLADRTHPESSTIIEPYHPPSVPPAGEPREG